MGSFNDSLTRFVRRPSHEVRVGKTVIGGTQPLRVQSMTNTDTNDTEASAAQIIRIAAAGGELVRLTAQGRREAAALKEIHARVRAAGCEVPLVADIHFLPEAALEAALWVDKVRINPGNFNDKGGNFEALIAICQQRGVALRIGVNHGSLAPRIVEQYGDTPQGMVASAMEFLERCRELDFDQVVVSIKSSNVRVMVQAYRALVARMRERGMTFPLHLGVTEAGNSLEGRIKSSVGMGALLADGIGDTLRVSLTEAPEHEIPVARELVAHFEGMLDSDAASSSVSASASVPSLAPASTPLSASVGQAVELTPTEQACYMPDTYRRRLSIPMDGVGGDRPPVLWSELSESTQRQALEVTLSTPLPLPSDRLLVLSVDERLPMSGYMQQRALFLRLLAQGLTNPVIIKRRYVIEELERLQIAASADLGPLFLDGFGDGIWIDAPATDASAMEALSLGILQASRVRISQPEYIACPGCGRTRYDLEGTLTRIKARTSHLVGVKIAVMGCIVNGPGEMADADYGYVGEGAGRITLYRAGEVVRRGIPEAEAIDALLQLIEQK